MSNIRNQSVRVRRHVWKKLYGDAYNVPCHWCGKILTFTTATTDHEPPLALGGSKYEAVISCWNCNHKRGMEILHKIFKPQREAQRRIIRGLYEMGIKVVQCASCNQSCSNRKLFAECYESSNDSVGIRSGSS